uniref:BACK domain-containing protein n=1 Tax=Globodera rostochiensis TaxID=31243 RepID=A0A914I0H2_GLORO
MSARPSEAVRHLRELNVSNDVLFGVFPFVGHNDLGLKVAPLSVRFDALVDKYFVDANWSLGAIEIGRAANGNGMAIQKRGGQIVPTPDSPLPSHIIGFRHILIRYIDYNVIAFLHRIERLFGAGIALRVDCSERSSSGWPALVEQILPFVACMQLNKYLLDSLHLFVSDTVLLDCVDLRVIDYRYDADEFLGQALVEWLQIPRADRRPKLLKYLSSARQTIIDIDLFKQAFINNTSSPVSYIVRLEAKLVDVDPFEMENQQTRELFTLRRVYNDLWFLERGPICQREVQCWDTDLLALKCNLFGGRQGMINIAIYDDDDIGPLSAHAEAVEMDEE